MPEPTIPVIDISAAVEGGTFGAVADQLGAVCRTLGFAQIVGHGIAPELLHAVYGAAEGIWAQPDEVLDGWRSPTGHPFRGVWYGLDEGDEHGADRARVWQRLQNTRIGSPEEALALGTDERFLDFFEGNLWPDVPGVVDASQAAFTEGRRVGATLMRCFAVDLGLGEEGFDPFFTRDVSYFAVQDYPAMPRPVAGGLRLGEHSDSGALTMLHQKGDYAGLQLRTTDGEIVTIPMMDEAIVINVGDLMARWTNDSYLATPHRVIDGAPGQGRTSIAMHYLPNVDALIAPLDSCVTGSTSYEPVLMYDWNMGYFNKKNRVLRLADA